MTGARVLLRTLTATTAAGLVLLGGTLAPAYAMAPNTETSAPPSGGCRTPAPQAPGTSVLHS